MTHRFAELCFLPKNRWINSKICYEKLILNFICTVHVIITSNILYTADIFHS
jgi:hypothetical protein